MKDKHDLVRGWITKAASDLFVVQQILDTPGPYDTACFHTQQAIEKLLKSILLLYDVPVPRTHDLEELQRLCLEVCPVPELAALDLTQITDYAVAARYDIEFWPERDALLEALSLVEEVQAIVSDIVSSESA
ncbi:MAG: HEPN domain-containing protein [Dehalococcoidia bacterium]|nr:HEPN domain-containing protein [Dehalococcoidia bacterium]